MRPSNALLLRLLVLVGPASLAACGAEGGASEVGSTTNGNSGAGGTSETAGSGGAAGNISGGSGGVAGSVSGGSGGASAGAGGAGGASAGAGGQASCNDGEKRIAQQFCPTPSCTDVMMEVCSKGQWTCYLESCPATGGAGGGAGAAGSESGGSGGFGGYTDAVCASGFCGSACAKTAGSCGLGSDPEVTALFQDCVDQFMFGEVPSQTTDSTGVTTCCWYQLCPGGRPLEIEGTWTQAPTTRRSDWS